MVGTLQQSGNQVALIDAAGQTFMVRRGNYMGQNFGLVTKISETEVDLKEIVQDAAGEWIERPTKLELQEAAQSNRGNKGVSDEYLCPKCGRVLVARSGGAGLDCSGGHSLSADRSRRCRQCDRACRRNPNKFRCGSHH